MAHYFRPPVDANWGDITAAANSGKSWSITSNVCTVTHTGSGLATGDIIVVSSGGVISPGDYTITGVTGSNFTFAYTDSDQTGTLTWAGYVWYTAASAGSKQTTDPGASDAVTIVKNMAILAAAEYAASVTVNDAGILSIADQTLTVTGATSISGTMRIAADGLLITNGLTFTTGSFYETEDTTATIDNSGSFTLPATGTVFVNSDTGTYIQSASGTYTGNYGYGNTWNNFILYDEILTLTVGRDTDFTGTVSNSFQVGIGSTLAVGAYKVRIGLVDTGSFTRYGDITGSGVIEIQARYGAIMTAGDRNPWTFTGSIVYVCSESAADIFDAAVFDGDFDNSSVVLAGRAHKDYLLPPAKFIGSSGTLVSKAFMASISMSSDLFVEELFEYPEDGFESTTANLAGKNGGVGFSAAWVKGGSHNLSINRKRLDYAKGGYTLSTGGYCAHTEQGHQAWQFTNYTRTFNTALMDPAYLDGNGKLGKDGTTLWMSMLLELLDVPPYPPSPSTIGWWCGFKLQSQATWFGRNAQSSAGNTVYGIEVGGASNRQDSTTQLIYNTPVLLVQKVVIGTAGATTTSLWVNPTPAATEATSAPPETADLVDKVGTIGTSGISRIEVDMSYKCNIGAIRIGKTYWSVAPSTASLQDRIEIDTSTNGLSITTLGDFLVGQSVVWDATASEGILIDGTADRHFGGAGQTLGEVNMGDNCTVYAQGDVSLKSLIGTTGVWRSTTDGSIVTLAVENTSACSNMSFKDISAGAAGMIDARDACVNLGNTKGIMFKELTSIIN